MMFRIGNGGSVIRRRAVNLKAFSYLVCLLQRALILLFAGVVFPDSLLLLAVFSPVAGA